MLLKKKKIEMVSDIDLITAFIFGFRYVIPKTLLLFFLIKKVKM